VTLTSEPPADRSARRDRLAAAFVYLCTDGRRDRGDLPEFLDAVLAAGVDVVQLREKHCEAAEELALLETVSRACRRYGALLAVNDRADLARLCGADIVHVGQRDLTPAQARAVVGPDVLIGRSTHSLEQATEAAGDPEVDYLCIGPVWPTPTKPGRPAAGPDAVRRVAELAAARRWRQPWFAIGGIDALTLEQAAAVGARRVVVVRALTQAQDPGAAADDLVGRVRALTRGGDEGRDDEIHGHSLGL
jgi:thiamine-phosphate pyrophosphorylase